jgi:histidyl-tRNA synthetase
VSKAIQAVRGMNDLLPGIIGLWQRVESTAREALNAYGYSEIRLPLVEKTELFARSIGDVTDIVEKEMYTFEDRNGDSLTLRPEGTAGCVRAGIENGILHNQVQRLWYQGPMFRHERPQKGRYRQFHQIGVEVFGLPGPDVDVELLMICARLWRELGLDGLQLQINSLGTIESRHRYRELLTEYLRQHRGSLDEDSLRRLEKNPLRVLDSKNPAMQPVIEAAPSLAEHLDSESHDHFARLCSYLDQNGIRYVVNPRLVRGLDYYTRTVFEWTTDKLGAQSAICAGGRYDGLVERLGGHATPAAGFAVGLERLIELLALQGQAGAGTGPQVYVVVGDEAMMRAAMELAERLRDAGLRTLLNCGNGVLKTQLKRADRSGARYAAMLGAESAGQGNIVLKDLHSGDQSEFSAVDQIISYLKQKLA